MNVAADLARIVRSLPDDRLLELVGPVLLSRAQEVLATTGKRLVLKRPDTKAERGVLIALRNGPLSISSICAMLTYSVPQKTIKNTLTRLKKQGRVVNRDGVWRTS